MKKRFLLALGILLFAQSQSTLRAADEQGFKSLFNGKDLTGWEGRKEHWSVEDGAITGKTTKENPAKGNNFLFWRPDGKNGTVSDFELRLSYKIVANNDKGFGNSGIQYRSKDFGNFVAGGYQADFEAGTTYSGILYEERMDGILAQRGQKTVVKTVDGKTKIEVVGSLGKSEDIQAKIKANDWNDYVVIAKGNHFQHFINGVQTVDVVDEREGGKGAKEGVLALQLHAGDPMTVQFKNIRIKESSEKKTAKSDMDLIQGEWTLVQLVANGEKGETDGIKLKIAGSDFHVNLPDGEAKGSFKINDKATPKTMDVETDGNALPAIYEVSEDTFRACYALNNGSRPTQFASAPNSDHVLAVYKRKQ